MLEFLFKSLKVSLNLFKELICKLFYMSHNYIIIETEKPFYTNEVIGSGRRKYTIEGIVVYATIECKLCGKRKRINLFENAINFRNIPKIELETAAYPNDTITRLITTFKKRRKGLFRLNISKNEEKFLEEFTKTYRCIKYSKINDEYILLLAEWGDNPNDYRTI